jgi:large subunit ribosomal protein L29
MKAADLRDRSTEDLAELEKSLAEERFQNKFKNFTNRLDDTSLIRKNKRDLARVKLILTERKSGITVVSKPKAPVAPKAEKAAVKAAAPKAEAKVDTEAAVTKTPKADAAAKAAPKKPKATKTEKGETK